MGEVTFGGLATGMDTVSLIDGLMAVEKRPLTLLENEKTLQDARKAALQDLDDLLQTFKDETRSLNERSDINSTKVSLSDSNYFSATSTSGSTGTYQVQVAQLAQIQKSVSQSGYDSIDTAYFGTGSIDVNGHSITISSSNNTLAGIRDAINDSNDTHGVSATIINDGAASNNMRLVLTGKDASTTFTFSSSLVDGSSNPIVFDDNIVQTAQQAEVYVDSIKIMSNTNTIEGAIDGVTLNLLQVSPLQDQGDPSSWTPVNMSVTTDSDEIVSRFEGFVSAYNGVMSFIGSQSKSEDNPDGGILLGDSGMNNIKSKMQRLLTSASGAEGAITGLSTLGLATQKDGTIKFEASQLRDHISTNMKGLELLIVGDDGKSGIINQFEDYLTDITNFIDGFYATKSDSIDRTVQNIDDQMEMMQMRLDKREESLQKKFNSLELLVSSMNSQSNFLTQQMEMMSKMITGS